MPSRRTALSLLAVLAAVLAVGGLIAPLHSGATAQPPATSSAAHRSAPPPSTPDRAGPLSLVALGDSVPSGFGCDCAGYVATVADDISALTGRPVTVHNDAVSGATSGDVATAVAGGPVARDLASSDLVLIQVGANDLALDRLDDPACQGASGAGCWAGDLAALRRNLARIVASVQALPGAPIVVLLDYWNVTVDGTVGAAHGPGFVQASTDLTRRTDEVIKSVAAASGAAYVDTRTPFKGSDETRDPTGELQDDGDHPNARGHGLIAAATIDALRSAGAFRAWMPQQPRP